MICQHCKSYKADEPHHIIPKGAFGKKTKHIQENPMNKIPLCRTCHLKHTAVTVMTKLFCDDMYKLHGQQFIDYMLENRHRNTQVSEWLTERGY